MLIVTVILAGIFIGVNNTITTQAVMTVAPVERPVASASYGFVRFIGGGLAPFAAGKLAERTNVHVPFYIGSAAIVLGLLPPHPCSQRRRPRRRRGPATHARRRPSPKSSGPPVE